MGPHLHIVFCVSYTIVIIAGWWYTYPSEKYESQLGLLFPIYGKIKTCSKPPTRYNIVIIVICTNLANELGPHLVENALIYPLIAWCFP